jgi:hypothetical protein
VPVAAQGPAGTTAPLTQPVSHTEAVRMERGPESAGALASRLGLRLEDGGTFLLLTDGVTRVRIFPNTHRISLDGEEQTLRGYFARGPLGVTVPAPAASIIERHVASVRARMRALSEPAPVRAPAHAAPVHGTPVHAKQRPSLPTPTALPKPMPKPPAAVVAPAASHIQPDGGWEVAAAPRAWKWIVLHHSDDTSGNLAKYHQVHLGQGWEHGCGYHFVIGNGSLSGDGQIEVSQRWTRQLHGAHAKTPDNRYNDFGIGITLVGDFERGSGRPTQAQMRSLVRLTQWLMDRYGIPMANVKGHCDCKATCCPGKNFPWTELRMKLRAPAGATAAAADPGPACRATHDAPAAEVAPRLAARAAPAAGAAPAGLAPGSCCIPLPPPLSLPPTGALPPIAPLPPRRR